MLSCGVGVCPSRAGAEAPDTPFGALGLNVQDGQVTAGMATDYGNIGLDSRGRPTGSIAAGPLGLGMHDGQLTGQSSIGPINLDYTDGQFGGGMALGGSNVSYGNGSWGGTVEGNAVEQALGGAGVDTSGFEITDATYNANTGWDGAFSNEFGTWNQDGQYSTTVIPDDGDQSTTWPAVQEVATGVKTTVSDIWTSIFGGEKPAEQPQVVVTEGTTPTDALVYDEEMAKAYLHAYEASPKDQPVFRTRDLPETTGMPLPPHSAPQYTEREIAAIVAAKEINDPEQHQSFKRIEISDQTGKHIVYERMFKSTPYDPCTPRSWTACPNAQLVEHIEFMPNGFIKQSFVPAWGWPNGPRATTFPESVTYWDAQRHQIPEAFIAINQRAEATQWYAKWAAIRKDTESLPKITGTDMPLVRELFAKHVNTRFDTKKETLRQFEERTLREVRLLSDALRFSDAGARSTYVGVVAELMAGAGGPFHERKYNNCTQGGPCEPTGAIFDQRFATPPDMSVPTLRENGGLDCSTFVTTMLYAAGVSFPDGKHSNSFNLNQFNGYNRAPDGPQPYTYKDDPIINGPMFLRNNLSLLQRSASGPSVGNIMIQRMKVKNVVSNSPYGEAYTSGHTVIVLSGLLTDPKGLKYFLAAEAGGRSGNINAGTAYYPDQYDPPLEFYEIKETFNAAQLGEPLP